ncbi:sensor domain-containing protein [Mycobacterium sp. EPa45]|uniref:sensor domain-containing protein n=1 Tax=Mycobacterium sp. EPa45 TaxID=1545728 RepID=UPI0009E4DE81|nr:sensor domain-containing protein [Mycobacterium sp. EPa45]
MTPRLPVIAALLCLSVSSCSAVTTGTALRADPVPLTSPDGLPALLLSAPDVGAALASDDVVVTTDVSKAWNDSAHFADANCLAIAGAAQQGVYAGSGSTAIHGQVLREAPTAPQWSHFAVQAVVSFPTAQAAADFFTASQHGWAACSNRELNYAQPIGPPQVWSVGQTTTDHGVLAVSRVQRSPQRWACQRALTVHSNVAVDVEACSLDGPTAAASAIAGQIAGRLPSA